MSGGTVLGEEDTELHERIADAWFAVLDGAREWLAPVAHAVVTDALARYAGAVGDPQGFVDRQVAVLLLIYEASIKEARVAALQARIDLLSGTPAPGVGGRVAPAGYEQ